MARIATVEQAVGLVKDNATVMIGGFLASGSPNTLIEAVAASKVSDLTLICNDTAFPDRGNGKLIVNRQVKRVITSHIGTNPETGRQFHAKEIDVELVPQGTLAERIRAGGSGLGGVLTPTGIGTIVAEGKDTLIVRGKSYLLEEPLRADVALVKAYMADKAGNLVYRRSARNFNPIMAMAADVVIAEVEQIVDVGEIDPDLVITPGILVDYLVLTERGN